MRRKRIDKDLTGLFTENAAAENVHRIVAERGWVVSALEVEADDPINAIRVEFAPNEAGVVLDEDRYWSKWYGSYARGERTVRLDDVDLIAVCVERVEWSSTR